MEEKFGDLTISLPSGPQDPVSRSLIATWTRGSASFEARLVRRGNLPVTEWISVSQPGRVTSESRRLPSDVDLMAAISRLGPESTALLLWLMEETIWVEQLTSVTEELIQKRLVTFATDLQRRKRSDRFDLVEKASEMLAEGALTTEIVTYLRTAGGVSRTTAYRILSRVEGRRPMAKRSRGDGSVYLRRDGRFEVAVVDPSTGRRHRAYARTETEANRIRRLMASDLAAGRLPMESSIPLEAYVKEWFKAEADRRRRPSTVREYRRRLDAYVLPSLGGKRLRDLTERDVEVLMDELAAQGRAKESIRGARNALAAVLTDAVRARLVTHNAARNARLPDMPGTPRIVPVTPEQVGKLLAEARGTDIEWLLTLVAYTGCRVGEALGAQWADIDLQAQQWVVARTVTRDSSGGPVLGQTTKTGDDRVLALSDEACRALRQQRGEVARARLKAGRLWVGGDLVFPSAVGTPQDPNNVRSRLRPIAKRAGFPASFHALRHFMVSVAASSGAPIAVIAKVVGHKRVATTADLYAHLLDQDAALVCSAVSLAVNRAVSTEITRLNRSSGE